MELDFLGASQASVSLNRPGVYAIVQRESRLAYVGQSANIARRLAGHRQDLIKDRHSNAELQNLWNVHGEDAFLFVPVEFIADRKEREAHEEKVAAALKLHGLCIANVGTVVRRPSRKSLGMPRSYPAERQKELRDRRKEEGLSLVRFWAESEVVEKFQRLGTQWLIRQIRRAKEPQERK